ncbi:flavin-containing monooxygenase [Sphingobium estronivorans]|uniref:flavin-containing monooxygenase n=1 Tax=Sphingobium estronivorans TaxID=1577690 RepID=UPI001F07593F|nr:NAD(P)/FAD-dependent oxidoreductase [Sphingobium estronivorans]
MKRVAIIGAGPGGICAGIKIKEAGYDDFVIIEKADGVGGTWRHNIYPGCRCDVPSSLYSFSFAIKTDWTERYASQAEILAYLESVVEDWGLAPHLRFGAEVRSATWHEDAACWHLTLSDGTRIEAEVLIGAVGLFNAPAMPDIPGLSEFGGAVMHSARWDRSIDLADRNVAVIGSAASAVQFVPEIAPHVRHLQIYQRTPNHVRPREEYTAEERQRLIGNEQAMREDRSLIFDWVDAICGFEDPELLAQGQRDCDEALSVVAHAGTRDRLRPDFLFGAKRPLVSSDWFPTFNRPNVELVTEPVDHVTASTIVTADGQERPVDVMILATGFETTRFLSVVDVTGRDGRRLDELWRDGARAYRGITISGFPNLFMLYGPNTNNGSILFNIERQTDYAVRHLERMEREDLDWIDLRPEAMDRYNTRLQDEIGAVRPWQGAVNGYYRAQNGLNVTQWPHGMTRYAQELAKPDFDAYDTAAPTFAHAEPTAAEPL